MKKTTALGFLALTCLLAVACGGEGASGEAEGTSGADLSATKLPTPIPLPPLNLGVCPPAADGFAQCFAIVVPNADGTAARTSSTPSGWSPAQLQDAYRIPLGSGIGTGGTVAIVDAYDNPNAESDLAAYRANYNLPACTTANGCFKKVNQTGSTTGLPAANTGWAPEIALDLDMASAGCPSCKILLVEATDSSLGNLGIAVSEAATLGATVISNSYGGADSAASVSYDSLYYNHPGIAITASTGDNGSASGHTPNYPAVGEHVIAVGGTNLQFTNTGARGWSETAWSEAGAGCSAYVAKPSWQSSAVTGCPMRAVADVSAVADPATAVAVYYTYGGYPGWTEFGGTSVASPLVAAIMAATGLGAQNAGWFYANPGTLYDVTSGCSGTSSPPQLTCAQPGWDGPTGLGTLDGKAMAAPWPCGLLPSGGMLTPGQSVYSCDGSHVLTQQTDGNVVLYNSSRSPWHATWSAANTWSKGEYTVMQGDGNFVVYNSAWAPIYSTGTAGHAGALLSVQDDGNMVVYSSSWAPLWASNTWNQ